MLRRTIPLLSFLFPTLVYAQGVSWELSDELDGGADEATFASSEAAATGVGKDGGSSQSIPVISNADITSPSIAVGGDVMRDEVKLLSGLTENELIEIFGEPDERVTSNAQNVWRYGESRLFLSAGKLIAWTNQDDVLKRARLRGYAGMPGERGFKDPQWRNSWKLRERTTSAEVFDELLGGSSSSEGSSQSIANFELMSGKSSTSSSEGSFSK